MVTITRPPLTQAQELKLRSLCERYNVDFDVEDYIVYPADSTFMPGWAEGWVGGTVSTIYIGVSPEGDSHS